MIITKTPFRISFCGGGSDLPVFYEKHGGCVLSAGINKYMYITIHPAFEPHTTVLKYAKTETVTRTQDIEHPIFRECLEKLRLSGVEIASTADVPAGTGLGSSSSFTVGLLHSLYCYRGTFVSKERLAQEACHVEIDQLGEPIGKQDQYAAAYGGLNFYEFNRDGSVFTEPVLMRPQAYCTLERSLMMFYVGGIHSASRILEEQGRNISSGERERNQLKICEYARALKEELQKGNPDALGELLHESWLLKRSLASGISSQQIDRWYAAALEAGALGGKLLGAGGGGFLLVYVKPDKQNAVRHALSALRELKFRFDLQGSSVIYVGDKPDYERGEDA